jgi:hypothetical protein
METTAGVYNSHEEALKAVEELKNAGFPTKQVSVIGQAHDVDGHIHVKTGTELLDDPMVKVGNTGLGIGLVLGPALGLLAGAGVFLIPGFGFLYGVGAVVGALAGLDLGIISGGLFNILTQLGVKHDHAEKYEEQLKSGKFLVVAHGNETEVKKAEEILSNAELKAHS